MYNFEYKKNLGQNFLKDDNIVDKIVNVIDYKKNNLVIEIGPGSGVMSKKLLDKVDFGILYEIDTRLEKILDKELSNYSNYEIIFDDFLKRNVKEDISKYKYEHLYIVANLPYYITTPIVDKIIKDNIEAEEIVIMVQKEVGDRFCALPGSREYGQLTVFLNYYYDIERITNVSKNCFIPKPKVDSSVVRMKRKDNLLEVKDMKLFEKLVRDSFRFKRKTIKNNLSGYDISKIEKILKDNGYDIDSRSECIPYFVFVKIANYISK